MATSSVRLCLFLVCISDSLRVAVASPPKHVVGVVPDTSVRTFVGRLLQLDGHADAVAQTAPETSEPLRVIGATLSRTGTLSLKTALERLGHKTYHGGDIFAGPYPALWAELARTEKVHGKNSSESSQALDALIDVMARDGFTATTDCPACALYGEFLERYPKAKVVLTVRDSPQAWAASALPSAMKFSTFFRRAPFRWMQSISDIGEMSDWLIPIRLGVAQEEYFPDGLQDSGEVMTRSVGEDAYERYVEDVKARIPAESLLIFNVKEGWRPLCDFLLGPDAPCPADSGEAFPKVNEQATIAMMLTFCQVVVWCWPLPVLGVCLAIFAIIRWVFRGDADGTTTERKTK